MAAELLRGDGLSRYFGGVTALDEVSVSVAEGEHVAIVGDNGAGKSTLVKILSGADQPSTGTLTFDGLPRTFRNPLEGRAAGIETVYQNLAVADDLPVVSNLFLGRERYKLRLGPFSILDNRGMRRDAREILASTGVRIPNLNTRLRDLSGGQRQCVAIARAAGGGGKLIVLDEPTAALGVQETGRVEDIVRGLKASGTAMILVSHDLSQVFRLVDTIWVLRRGRLVASVPRESVTGDDVVALITGARDEVSAD